MIIKKYIANSVEEARSLIEQELGEKAVILTSRYMQPQGWRALFSANKVEITASIEEEDLKAYNKQKLGMDHEDVNKEQSLNSNLEGLKRLIEDTQEQEKKVAPPSSATYGDPRFQRKEAQPAQEVDKPIDQERAQRKLESLRRNPSNSKQKPKKNVNEDLENLLGAARQLTHNSHQFSEKERELDEKKLKPKPQLSEAALTLDNLRKVVREEVARTQNNETSPSSADDEEPIGGVRFLVNKGIDRSIAKQIEMNLDQTYGQVDIRVSGSQRTARLNALKTEIAKLVRTTGPLMLGHGRPTLAAFIGPTGVGKTTTMMKIAGYHSQILDKKVAIISLDSEKMGARDQIKELTLKFGLPLTVVRNKNELRDAVTLYRSYDLVLIDTSGVSQYNPKQLEDLAEDLNILPGLQRFLTISATTKDVDAYGIIERFSGMPVHSVVVTKLDETIADGLLVNLSVKTNLPLSYLTAGQRIPGDLKIADAEEVAKEILVQHNSAEFDTIRQLVNS